MLTAVVLSFINARVNTRLMNLLWKIGISEITRGQMIVHLLHRAGAIIVAVLIGWTTVKTLREHRGVAMLVRPAIALSLLACVQITLGILTILTEKQYTITTLHVATGAVTLATSLALAIKVRHVVRAPEVSRVAASATLEEAVT